MPTSPRTMTIKAIPNGPSSRATHGLGRPGGGAVTTTDPVRDAETLAWSVTVTFTIHEPSAIGAQTSPGVFAVVHPGGRPAYA